MFSDAASSPAPFSPFSTHSVISDTSDEIPDLGAFASVFRALSSLQPVSSARLAHTTARPSSGLSGSEAGRTTVRPARAVPIPYSVRSSYDPEDASDDVDEEEGSATSDTENDDEGQALLEQLIKELQMPTDEEGSQDDDRDQPTLGALDEALGFLAAERSRLAAARDGQRTATSNATNEETTALRRLVIAESKRKRKRKKSRHTPITSNLPNGSSTTADYESSSPERRPATVASTEVSTSSSGRSKSQKRKDLIARLRTSASQHVLRSQITTQISSSPSTPVDPRVMQLRSLNTKLRKLFPEEPQHNHDPESVSSLSPTKQDTLIHVFVDHSNILIGFLNFLRRHPCSPPIPKQKQKHMSHAALAYILERGRQISRRVLVTSSPLYQPIESAEQLGYEVRVYARVPDLGDGQDRTTKRHSAGSGAKKTHHRSPSSGGGFTSAGTSTESDVGVLNLPSSFPRTAHAFPQTLIRSNPSSYSRGSGAPTPQVASGSGTGTPSTPGASRIKYREQGVDELLQLKLHQAIAAVDVPPPGATIVLATGDGNVGQFNDDGFLGPVRTALKKGWRVELYAWEDGLSKSWIREFSQGAWKDQFRIVFMETFGADLLELEV